MRKLKVRPVRLPGVGELFELAAASGLAIRVVSLRSGRKDLVLALRTPMNRPSP